MVCYSISTKVTKIEVIDDGVGGAGATHDLRLWTYGRHSITQAAEVDFRLRRSLKTGDVIETIPLLSALYSHKDIIKHPQEFHFTVRREIPGDVWGASASAKIELDPARILGDCIWYIETHAASRTKPGVSKIKIWFKTKTQKIPIDVMAISGNIVAFSDRDCQGSYLKLTDQKFSVRSSPHGDTSNLPVLSDHIYRIRKRDLGALGDNAMSSIGYYNADSFYVWLYEHDFESPLFSSGRSRRFTGLPRWNATYANLASDGLLRWPDNSLDNKVSAMEVAMRRPPDIG